MVGLFPQDRVTIVDVMNLTPDSLSAGEKFQHPPSEAIDVVAAIRVAERLLKDGAHVLHVGGESTRPGAREVPGSFEVAA